MKEILLKTLVENARLREENNTLMEANDMLQEVASLSYREGLDKGELLFQKLTLTEFIRKLKEKSTLRCADTQEIIILERDIAEVLKEMEIEL